MNTFDPKDVGAVGADILRAGPICNECLGRIASKLGRGMTNGDRGELIRQHTATQGVASRPGACWVCGGLFEQLEDWVHQAVERVQKLEFSTYLFGIKLTTKLEQMDAFYEERFPSRHREALKHSLNRMMGLAFERLLGRPVTVAFKEPEVSFVVDLNTNQLAVHVLSLYVYGRYCKHERGIPQTKWPCRRCRGRGCEECDFSGKQYADSVEEIIAAPLLSLSGAESACLHGAGREDIDARMLGSGRPFVLELRVPARRSIELADVHQLVQDQARGRVTITPLRHVHRNAVAWVKETRSHKSYRALVEFDEPVNDARLQDALHSLPGEIAQQTPRRVSHRRADLIRRRMLHDIAGELTDATHADITVHGDGGLYIKELISGDEQRTQPSLSGRLGVRALVTDLDVLEVCCGDVPESMELGDGLS